MESKPGTLENLTEEQRNIKNEIQKWLKEEKQVTDDKWTDWYTLRFCRARKFKVPEIKLMIEKYLNWAKEIDLDAIGNLDMTKYEPIKNMISEGYCNTDKDGRSVYISRAKFLKADEVFKNFTDKELVDYYVQSYERLLNIILPEVSNIQNRRIDTCTTIIDLDGVSVFKLFGGKLKKFLQISTQITQDYYPELMHKVFIINAGYFFQGVWVIIKPWLDPVTQKKITIITGSGKKELLQHISKENLPDYFSGEFQGALIENHGPWKEALTISIKNKTCKHHNQKMVDQYFLTKEEYEKKYN